VLKSKTPFDENIRRVKESVILSESEKDRVVKVIENYAGRYDYSCDMKQDL